MQLQRLLLIAMSGAALAAAQVDPPGRVARLSRIDGSVSFAPAGWTSGFPQPSTVP
jgi:hypothetical protein